MKKVLVRPHSILTLLPTDKPTKRSAIDIQDGQELHAVL